MSETAHVSFTSELANETNVNVDIVVKFDTYRDGIGSYEFWGFKGYDAGRLGVENVVVVSGLIMDLDNDKLIACSVDNLQEIIDTRSRADSMGPLATMTCVHRLRRHSS